VIEKDKTNYRHRAVSRIIDPFNDRRLESKMRYNRKCWTLFSQLLQKALDLIS
jgi:hypothetical protein